MISVVRDYIKSQIAVADSSLKQKNSAFYDSDIGESIMDKTYQITMDNIVNTLRTDYREYEIPVSVNIFGKGYRDEVTNYDLLLDKSLCILDNIINLRSFNNTNYIVNIFNGAISSEQIPDDDNSFKVNISFNVMIAYTE